MFGFLRPSHGDRTYRQVYAGCCGFQHGAYGIESLPLLSYEAIFLYALAVDADACERPDESCVTCCRLRKSGKRLHVVDRRYAEFCSAFGLLLASIKLEDDVRDDRSWLARLALWRLRPRVDRARAYFARLDAGFDGQVRECIDRHLRLEQADGAVTLDEFAEPTARAFGYVFKLFGRLISDDRTSAGWFAELGNHVGRAIICFDCAVDWRRDRARGRFNPLANRRHVERALLASQESLAAIGWLCCEAFDRASLTSAVAGESFRRVQRRVEQPANRSAEASRQRNPRWMNRRGDCDCLCEPSCCDACGGDGGSCCCEAIDAAALCPCDCCCDWSTRRSTEKSVGETPPPTASRVGAVGRTVGPLNPSGVVTINDMRVPARSEGEWIDAATDVVVVRDEPFGVVVRPRE